MEILKKNKENELMYKDINKLKKENGEKKIKTVIKRKIFSKKNK